MTLRSFSSSLAISVAEGFLQTRGSTTVTTATMMAQVGDAVNAKMFTVELQTFTNITACHTRDTLPLLEG